MGQEDSRNLWVCPNVVLAFKTWVASHWPTAESLLLIGWEWVIEILREGRESTFVRQTVWSLPYESRIKTLSLGLFTFMTRNIENVPDWQKQLLDINIFSTCEHRLENLKIIRQHKQNCTKIWQAYTHVYLGCARILTFRNLFGYWQIDGRTSSI